MEARIKAVLKGLRKFKGPNGELKVNHFEKLPDKAQMPEYFEEIKVPMAFDVIKVRAPLFSWIFLFRRICLVLC
jgi:chromatin structure-remodeling complex subunit RSC1/2